MSRHSTELPDGFHDPLELDTPTLEGAVRAARLDRFDGTESLRGDLETWLEIAEAELQRRADWSSTEQRSAPVLLETRDGTAFSTMLERTGRGWAVRLSDDRFQARVPLTAFIAALLAHKLGKRVVA